MHLKDAIKIGIPGILSHGRRMINEPERNMTSSVAISPTNAGCETYCEIAPEHPAQDHPAIEHESSTQPE